MTKIYLIAASNLEVAVSVENGIIKEIASESQLNNLPDSWIGKSFEFLESELKQKHGQKIVILSI